MHYLITGGAGFIGSHLAEVLISLGHRISVIDNFDEFYSKTIKLKNLEKLIHHPSFHLYQMDIRNHDELEDRLNHHYDAIIHLAAKAGVRPSIQAPMEYQSVNGNGTQSLLEFAKERKVKKFIFASSSSVYGINKHYPWSEDDHTLLPISPYASTKITGELLGHVYHKLHGIQFLALRFFTVYGPRQRPDLAINKFCRKILKREPIPFYGDGSTKRDYTYIDDIINGIIGAIKYNKTGYEVINLGNSKLTSLTELVKTIEKCLGIKAIINYLPAQAGDVPITCANITKAKHLLDYHPQTDLKTGIARFVSWMNLRAGSR